MQPLARDGFTAVQVEQIILHHNPTIGFGCDLLDDDDQFVEDISDDVISWSIERSMYADVHAKLEVTLLREVGPTDRLRPWLTMAADDVAGGQPVRFDQGVFLPTAPERDAGETPQPIQVTGLDKMSLLQREVGDTYVIASSTSYLQAIRDVLDDAGLTSSTLLLDGTRQGTELAEAAVWLLSDQPATWLRVINDLLAMIGYRGLWADEQGRFRSRPYRPPTEFGPEWTFDVTDQLRNIVEEDRSLSADVWDAPNLWRFVRKQAAQPTDGNGIYIVDRTDGLAAWQINRKTVHLDAADQAGLVTQGDAIVAEDTANTKLLTIATGPLPAAGHFDIVRVVDPELLSARCQTRRWSLASDGAMRWELEVLDG